MYFCQACLYSSSYGQQILEDFGQCQWVPGEGPGRGGGGGGGGGCHGEIDCSQIFVPRQRPGVS